MGAGLRVVLVLHPHVLLCRTKFDAVNGAIHVVENPTQFNVFGDNTSSFYRSAKCSTNFCTAPTVTRADIGNYPMGPISTCSPVVSSHPLVGSPKAANHVPNAPIPLLDNFVDPQPKSGLLAPYHDGWVLFDEIYFTLSRSHLQGYFCDHLAKATPCSTTPKLKTSTASTACDLCSCVSSTNARRWGGGGSGGLGGGGSGAPWSAPGMGVCDWPRLTMSWGSLHGFCGGSGAQVAGRGGGNFGGEGGFCGARGDIGGSG